MLKKITIVMMLFFTGCSIEYKYITLELPKKNPTSYQFSAPVSQIQNTIKNIYDGHWVFYYLNSGDVRARDKNLQIEQNMNDVIIYPFEPHESYIYKGIDNPIWYSAKYHIHIVNINDTTTQVEVRTLKPNIGAGTSWRARIGLSHSGDVYSKEVPPSTIEEYQILLKIGEKLGVKDKMPPLILPEQPPSKK